MGTILKFSARKIQGVTMHVKGFLHKMLSSVMHKKRLSTFILFVTTAIEDKKLSLTALGRGLQLPIQERSCIRRADRFLGNKNLHEERQNISKELMRQVIGNRKKPDIIVDWSPSPNTTHHILRAAVVAKGRALTIYEEVHPEKKLGNKKVQNKFLQTLHKMLPKGCEPIIITDAGFHNDWFKEVVRLRWDFIGRIRGKKYFKKKEAAAWKLCKSLFKKATSTPQFLGKVELCRSNAMEMNFFLFKGKSKGRKSVNKVGKKRKDSSTKDYRKAAKEPWLLATSLRNNYLLAKKVVKKFSNRMQIEEGFRDLKSSRYGFGFEDAYSRKRNRIEILLLIAMFASFIAWIIGWIGEKEGLQYKFQSNSIKNRRTLSLFFLGCQIIKRKIPINLTFAMGEALNYEK